jgi:streptomycin 6-kinase
VTVGRLHGPIPSQLDWLKAREEGRAWLESLPTRIDECVAHWRLELAQPFPYAFTSVAIPGRNYDGSDVVLKVRFVDRETEHEPVALRSWNGDGSVLLLDELEERGAMLLERCIPGTSLSDAGSETALEVLIGLLPRLWKPATSPPFRTLGEESAWWALNLRARWREAGRPFEEELVDAALDVLSTLPLSQGETVLLDQDLHGANVLAAKREPWLAIDPKPLVGEREFGLAPIIRSSELGHSRRDVLRRLDRLSSDLRLDRERARLWCFAQTVAWSIETTGALQDHVDVARWLLRA